MYLYDVKISPRGGHDDFPDPRPLRRLHPADAGDLGRVSLFAASAICLAVIGNRCRARPLDEDPGTGSVDRIRRIGLYLALIDPELGTFGVKLSVDIGIFVISLGSMLIRQPFTLQYALEAVDAETAKMPGFLTANYVITWAWTAPRC